MADLDLLTLECYRHAPMSEPTCPACQGSVIVLGRTLQGVTMLTEYRCRACGRRWAEVTDSAEPSRLSPSRNVFESE